ncbi:MAG: hypothetical protein LBF83_08795 [Spirochaetaceae bacterium]|jgi:hypothetical protein|nr:hypothetical protein [Spirochaetaceae bacterium]
MTVTPRLSRLVDALEGYLKKHSILLIRRPGMGVYTVGNEEKIRTALTMRLFQDGRDDHPDHRIEHFANCRSCVLMLLPHYAEGDMARIMGNISAALVETPSFLEAVKATGT